MTAAEGGFRRALVFCGVVLAVSLGVAACGQSSPGRSAATTTTTTTTAGSSSPSSKGLTAPKTSFAQDTTYLTDIAEADPSLVTWEQKQGNSALEALLTDGSAFCALLHRGGGIDQALVAEAEGARSTESQTSLPLSVTTFNTIESVALLALCPSELKLVPASVRSKVQSLGAALAQHTG